MSDEGLAMYKVGGFALREILAKAASGLWKFDVGESRDGGLSVCFEHRRRDEVYQFYDLEEAE